MRRNQLEAEITSALSDGVISKDERKKIEDLRQQLNISEEDALAIMSYLSREAKAAHKVDVKDRLIQQRIMIVVGCFLCLMKIYVQIFFDLVSPF